MADGEYGVFYACPECHADSADGCIDNLGDGEQLICLVCDHAWTPWPADVEEHDDPHPSVVAAWKWEPTDG